MAEINSNPECGCLDVNSLVSYTDFNSRYIGDDPQNGRYAEVSLEDCRYCGRVWLRYYFSYEHFSRSGRWYRGVVSPEVAARVSPENAATILETLEWYLAGGSYFDGKILRLHGPILG